MKKINVLKENRDFNRIISTKKSYKYKDYIIYVEETDGPYQFGISVSKKIGNAVVRNKIKRQLRSIIDKYNYQKNFNCIIIVLKGILNKSYIEMDNDLLNAFKNIKIIKE